MALLKIKDGRIFRAGAVNEYLNLLQQLGQNILEQKNDANIKLYMDQLRNLGMLE